MLGLAFLFAAGCGSRGNRGEQPIIEGPLRFLEVKTSETSREGGGDFTVPVHAKLYRDYLLVTYSPRTRDERTEVIPANRIWKVEFAKGKPRSAASPKKPAP